MPSILISGASRGIGLALAEQALQMGARVFGAARHPAASAGLQNLAALHETSLHTVQMDITSKTSIEEAASTVAQHAPEGIDLLMNSAGLSAAAGFLPILEEQGEDFEQVLATNVVGTFRVTAAFLPLLRLGRQKQIVNISSTMGSLAMHRKLGAAAEKPQQWAHMGLPYCASKAGLSMQTLMYAAALKPERFTVIAMHPGWVATDMGRDNAHYFGVDPTMSPEQSASSMLKTIAGLTPEQSGRFLAHDGSALPW